MTSVPGALLGIITVAGVITVFEHFCKTGSIARTFTNLFRTSKKTNDRQVPRDVAQAIVKVIGMIHLAIQIPLAWSVIADPSMQKDRLHSSNPRSDFMLIFSAGYFLHDAVTCIRNFEDWGPAYLLHAVSCCTLYSYGALSGSLHYYGAAFLLWECSTPFVYVRWFLYKMDKERSKLYLYNGLTMVVTFFLCRNVFGTVMSIDYWRTTAEELSHPHPNGLPFAVIWLYRICNVALNALNLYWFSLMARGALRVLQGGGPHKRHDR